jgi:RHS repeat-associated protein
VVAPEPLGSAVYNPANRITSWDGTTFTWDPAGNLTSNGATSYTWNARGELATVSDGSSTWNHTYDGMGGRIGIDNATTAQQWLFDGPNPIVEYTDGIVTATLLDGLGMDAHHTRTTGGVETNYLTDLVGTTLSLADSTGITSDYAYTPYGQTTSTGDPAGNSFTWTGRPLDPTGLYQLRARYYHPDLQRFISEDPLGLAAGPTNYYVYAGNNPISHTDPTGLAADVLIDVGFIAYDAYNLFTGGRKNFSSNLGTLGLDVLGALIPFVTGLGAASKAARFGDDLVDAGRGLGRFGDNAANIGRACSFDGETEVLMADGTTKPISQIKVGDMVLAEDPETGERGPRTVTRLWVHEDTLINLEIDGDVLATTEDHPFWNATDRQWQRADALDRGDMLITADGDLIEIDGLNPSSTNTTTAYNLTVDDIHTYFIAVGDDQVLVHNTCNIPGRPFRGPNAPERAFDHLAEFHGIDQHVASNRLHRIKDHFGIGAAEDVVIGRTGDVYNAATGEWLATLTDVGWGK